MALEVERDRVAVIDAPSLHRLEARGAHPQPLHRLFDSLVFDTGRPAADGHGPVIAGLEGRHRVERRRERERLTLEDRHLANVRRIHRLDPTLPQGVIHRARNEIVRDVVQDLILEPLLDHPRRRLPRAEAGYPRLARVIERDAVDLGVDHIRGNLDTHVLARLVDVDELGFHLRESGDGSPNRESPAGRTETRPPYSGAKGGS